MRARRSGPLAALILLLLTSAPAAAEPVSLAVRDGITARADFRTGQQGRPAVLILHGMLQTHQFGTVRSLADSLAAHGFPVLTPTLSLGIDRRRQSLDCGAIHSHALDGDIHEIRRWVRWLAERTSGPVVLVGHSTGGLKLLAYLQTDPHPRVEGLVAASLAGFASWTPDIDAAAQMRLARSVDGKTLRDYSMGYCSGSYTAPPAPFRSYMRWDAERILAAVAESPVPVQVVLGSEDKRVPSDWPARLRQRGAEVAVIDGAGHFFRGLHELALGDTVRKAVRDGSGG